MPAQVEFYFSDSNFRHDKFLRLKASEDSEGYVPLSVLLTFNRLKALGATQADVADALEDSMTLEVDSNKAAVRRVKVRHPLVLLFFRTRFENVCGG